MALCANFLINLFPHFLCGHHGKQMIFHMTGLSGPKHDVLSSFFDNS